MYNKLLSLQSGTLNISIHIEKDTLPENINRKNVFGIKSQTAKVFIKSDELNAMPKQFNTVANALTNHFFHNGVTKVVGVAARGMPLAVEVAKRLGVPYVIAGKSGKMPWSTLSTPVYRQNAHLERLELQVGKRKIKQSDKIGIIDNRVGDGAYIEGLLKLFGSDEINVAAIGTLSNDNSYKHNQLIDHDFQKYNLFSYSTIHGNNVYLDTKYDDHFFSLPERKRKMSDEEMKNQVIVYRNFPKEHIHWTDFGWIQYYPDIYMASIDRMMEPFKDQEITKIVSLAVRGIDFGATISQILGIPHIVAGHPEGLTSGELFAGVPYGMEYKDNAVMAIPLRYIKPGDKILLIDDITATGGSMNAAYTVTKGLGAEVIGATTLIGLRGVMEKSIIFKELEQKIKYHTVLDFSQEELEIRSRETNHIR